MNDHQRLALYRSLARLLEAGLPPGAMFDTLRAGHRSRAILDVIASLERSAREGLALSECMERAGRAIPRHDALAMRAAESVGGVPEALRELADEEEKRLRSRRDPLLTALYAIALLHLAVIAPNSGLFYADPLAAAIHVLWILAPIDLLLAVGWLLLTHPPRSTGAAMLLLFVPGLARTIVQGEYRAYFASLQRLVEAGIPVAQAAREALDALGNAGFRKLLAVAVTPLDYGKPLADVLPRFPRLEPQVQALLANAESVGELDGALLQAAALCSEIETASRVRLARSVAALIYCSAALYVAARLVLFYAHHFGRLAFDSF